MCLDPDGELFLFFWSTFFIVVFCLCLFDLVVLSGNSTNVEKYEWAYEFKS